jgi:MtrB/PioB family decaheme-associated outer membrane protein
VEYSHEQRTGTRPTALSYGWGTTANPRATNVVEVPQPIDDVTQNVSASGEYVGTTPWGTRWTSALKYVGSFYTNNIDQPDVQNPFCITCNVLAGANRGPNVLRLASYADNQSNAVTWTTSVGLPFLNGRYVGTVQYNKMQQNDPFVSTATNGLVAAPLTLGGVPVSSLNGEVNALLVNNVLTANVGKDLRLTVKGRHYDFDNRTPSLLLTNYVASDSGIITAGGTGRMSLPLSFTKNNASAELVWRTWVKWLSIGSGYYWEQWDRKFRDVDETNEHMGKIWINADPVDWARVRASFQYSERRYGEYNTVEFVEHFAGPGNYSEVAFNMRKFDIANRNRIKAEAFVELAPLPNVTITPNAGLRFDDYPDDVINPLGLRKHDDWNVGIELGLKLSPTLRLLASYNYEDQNRKVDGGAGGANVPFGLDMTGCPTSAVLNPLQIIGSSCTWRSDITQQYHTVMLAADWKAIPNTLEFRIEYITAQATEANVTTPCPSGVLACTGGGVGVTTTQFPDEKNIFQRFNVTGRYIVDPALVQKLGWTGEVVAKIRYTWERNHADNWAFDTMTPYIPTPDQTADLTGGGRSLFLAPFNPNYTAQIIAGSLAFRW